MHKCATKAIPLTLKEKHESKSWWKEKHESKSWWIVLFSVSPSLRFDFASSVLLMFSKVSSNILPPF